MVKECKTFIQSTNTCLPSRHVSHPIATPVTHFDNLPTGNPCFTRMQVPTPPRVAHAHPLPPSVLHHPLGRPVRLTGWPDSGGHPTGCWGDSTPLGSLGNTPLVWTDSLVAQTRWGTPPGHMPGALPGVRFATREPAPVVQLVVQSPCRDQYELAESLKNTGQRGGDFTSRVRHSSHRYPQNA